ncbi:MAG: L-serine ammonia-lyase, iron-sulfur-dependent, subunit alpha [Saprospiraceae bacterium]|nr:L-serine ammonia-lyase, iron-sulfur-dependent, subunit alpha [Saprospiraceae bacterium]
MSYPSIFNDVLGPVMRGPSSSHCAASLRIGRLCLDLMDGHISKVEIEFDPDGSLATTHEAQGSDMGLFGGFLGWEADDERLENAGEHIARAGIEIDIKITELEEKHPNTYKITLHNPREKRELIALSTGGGMIEVIGIDGAKVDMDGGYFETLIYTTDQSLILNYLKSNIAFEDLEVHESGNLTFIEVKSRSPIDDIFVQELNGLEEVLFVKGLRPVLPVFSKKNLKVPFITCAEMYTYNEDKNLDLWELAVHYESQRGSISHDEVIEKMRGIHGIMKASIETGLKGTQYEDRILGSQSPKFKKLMDSNKLIDGAGTLNRIVSYVSAIMEVKSSLGVIVAAPTAGSCGAMPGAVIAVGDALSLTEDEVVKAMLVAGLIGVFIAAHSTFAAEVGGCQAECGSGSTMAAAAIVGLAGGSLDQGICAASMALQSSLGMICDPIGNRVEAPCLNRNVMAASNALSCANMALADYDHLIPLDQVIETMYEVGKSIPNTLRCTNLGGLSITKAAKEIEEKLGKQYFYKNC